MNAAAEPDLPNGFDAIALSAADHVATVLRAIEPGDTIRVKCGEMISLVAAAEAIPYCHKVSLVALPAGMPVLKYGSPIGTASCAIASGAHVHVHNLRSNHARQHEAPNEPQ